VAKWRLFAEREFPRVVAELALPAATSRSEIDTCPTHNEPVGPATRLCGCCFHEAWDEVARRYSNRQPGSWQRGEPMSTTTTAETVVDNETGELERYEPQPATNLFLTNDPDTFLQKATEAAAAVARVVRERKLFTTIRGKDHVHIGGWTLCASLLGVYAITEWTRPVDDGWEARVVARTRAGELIGGAESMCTRAESRWRTADEYAIRSMAATRAASKALRLPLGFIFELAEFDATPAEEMPADTGSVVAPSSVDGKLPPELRPTQQQVERMRALIGELEQHHPGTDWRGKTRELAGCPGEMLTATAADMLIRELEGQLR
jgi:hypothetical protein